MAISFIENIISYPERFEHYFNELGYETLVTDHGVWNFDGRVANYIGPVENKNIGINLPFKSRSSLLCYTWQDSFVMKSRKHESYILTNTTHRGLDDLDSIHRMYLERDLSFYRTRRVEIDEVLHYKSPLLNKVDTSVYKKCTYAVFNWDYYTEEASIIDKKYEDIVQYFGIFFESRMIGYAKFFILGKHEAQLQEFVIDPDFEYLKVALCAVYYFSNYYLHENDYKCLNLGFPFSPVQETLVDELLNQYNFSKKPVRFNVHIPPQKKFAYDLDNYLLKHFRKTPPSLTRIRALNGRLNYI